MLHAFTDESYSLDAYFQGALIIPEEELILLSDLIKKILIFVANHGVKSNTEIHGHSIMNSAHGWEALQRKYALKIRIIKKIFIGIADTSGSLLIAGVRLEPHISNRIQTKSRHIQTHNLILEMINDYARAHNDEVLVYSDETTIQKRLYINFVENSEKFEQIQELSFINSKTSPGIQLVDVCLYIFHRMNLNERKTHSSRYELISLWEIISHLIHKDFDPQIIALESTEGSQ